MIPIIPSLLLLLPGILAATPARDSPKRGLIHITDTNSANDDTNVWLSASSIHWYYNYGSSPSSSLASAENLTFVPMCWGETSSFRSEINALSTTPSHILGFNEPDQSADVGGSDISPKSAASIWKDQIEPLASDSTLLGAPAISGSPDGLAWLADFFDACDDCTFDFLAVHWYGNFEGLASFLGEVNGTYPKLKIWVTEFGIADVSLEETMTFFNTSLEYLERLESVERYSWFGGFRSDESNVGPNGAMLNGDGKVNELGGVYLGEEATSKSAGARIAVGCIVWLVLGACLLVL